MNDYLDSIEERIASIPAPKFDFSGVQLRAERKLQRPMRRRNVIAGILLIIAAPLLAVAAVRFVPLQVTHRFGNWQLYSPGKNEMQLHPRPEEFSRLAHEAPYRVVWPAGLPRDSKPFMLGSTGSEVFTILYSCAGQRIDRASTMAIIIPKNYASVNPNLGNWFSSQVQDKARNAFWDVGNESVFFGSDCLTNREIARVRAETIIQESGRNAPGIRHIGGAR